MGEPAKEFEITQPKLVGLEGGHLGHEIKEPGDTFKLSNIFSDEGSMYLGGDAFKKVYFRTESGNIYLLDWQGRLINSKESKKTGKLDETDLDLDDIENQELVVGEVFLYGRGGRTTKIVEIVPTQDRVYTKEYLAKLPSNSIDSDFNKGMPPFR